MIVKSPGTSANFSALLWEVTTHEALPRSTRSRRSFSPSITVVGIMGAPSLVHASMVSHSSTWLPSMRITRSPRCTPWPRSHVASWDERRESSA